ncbi:MAG: 4-(cytidine 5'-diphospho)-2-C-methyl-D-erythritol kinase [Burkholderiales bacterium]|nr:4-(cytidine 5'-diphospho)-2-C-methyl-D-erythritol kinase [Burkholderiales bacterium]
MPERLVLPAPAKLNLFLHVTGRRADGYHLLESVFVPITLFDTVSLTRRDDGVVALLDAPDGLTAENDLACRAARALQSATHCRLGVDIRLQKRIPQGGGLGGGSSDAATTLFGLNRLWQLGLSRAELLALALPLGADVPFFIHGRAALARGIGEHLLTVTVPSCWAVVAFPGTGVATGPVFSAVDLRRDTPPLDHAALALNHGHNDLQPVAERIEPRVAALRAAFVAAGATGARMTGSGACVFALCTSDSGARPVQRALSDGGWQAWVVRTLGVHPLVGLAT